MTSAETISISLSPEMLSQVREAVDTGEFASSSEVVRQALLDWTRKRQLPQTESSDLKALWYSALEDESPGTPMDNVMGRLKTKYQDLAEASISTNDAG